VLQDRYAFLRQKICLMALIESVFSRPAGQRVVAFDAIAADTCLPENEVEHLLMKAMSSVPHCYESPADHVMAVSS
jgi:26S proteasome regulatory subunit N9